MRSFGATLLALLLTAPAIAAVKGELCIQSAVRCQETEGRRLTIAPASTGRDFVWTQSEGSEIVAGIVEPQRDVIDLDESFAIALTIDAADEAPVGHTIALHDKRRTTPILCTIAPNRIAALRKLRVPLTVTELEISAPHHRPVRKAIAHGIGRVVLHPYPVIQGVVRTSATKAEPIGSALVILPSEATLTTTDASGRFRAEVTDDWPAYLKIAAPSRGTAIIDIPRAEGSLMLPPISLGKGGSARLTLENAPEGTEVELSRRDDNTVAPVPVAHANAGDNGIVTFNDLSAGDYVAVIRGPGPLQILTAELRIEPEQVVEKTVTIHAATLRTFVHHKDEPVPDAVITLSPGRGEWRSTFSVNAEGRSTTEIWQQGEFGALVKIAGQPNALFLVAQLNGSTDIDWDIDAPNRRVHGVVIGDDRQPIAGANVSLEIDSGDRGGQMHATADEEGRFTFSYVPAGHETLRATAPAHLDAQQTFDLAESDDGHTATVVLARAREVRVLVRSANGAPLADAAVVDDRATPWITDAAGIAIIPFAPDETKTLYVFPREGSFTIADVREQAEPVAITVASAAASITVQARTESGAAIPGVQLALRYNGRLIPTSVREVMFARQGHPFGAGATGDASFRNLPTGLYEFWPWFTPAEERRIAAGLAPPPPVRLGAQPGENTVVLTFTPARHGG